MVESERILFWKIIPSYIDETIKEQFIEDTTIREANYNIYDMLADMPKEKRLAFFGQISKPKDLDFVKEMDGIYYVVCANFDREQREDMITKVNRIISIKL